MCECANLQMCEFILINESSANVIRTFANLHIRTFTTDSQSTQEFLIRVGQCSLFLHK